MCNIETGERCTSGQPYEADVSYLNGSHTGSKIRASVQGGATVTDRVVTVHHNEDPHDEARPFKTWVKFQNVRPPNNQLRLTDDAFLVYGYFEVID